MKAFLLLVILGCAMLIHPGIVLLAALYLYVAHRIGAALKRKRRVYHATTVQSSVQSSVFIAPPARVDPMERFRRMRPQASHTESR